MNIVLLLEMLTKTKYLVKCLVIMYQPLIIILSNTKLIPTPKYMSLAY